MPRPRCDPDGGSVTVVAAALVGVVLALALAVASAGGVLVERHRLAGAADAAALAAADAASGMTGEVPCDSAGRLASAGGARMTSCRTEGSTATIELSKAVGPFAVRATATAGQPSSSPGFRTAPSKK